MATKVSARRKSKSEDGGISLLEFRAWLQGIEEMQGDTWAPNTEQWKKIKAKIADIVEEEVETSPVPARNTGPQVWRSGEPQAWGGGIAPASPTAPPIPAPRIASPISNTNPTKTPDIDSSNGYNSSLI